METVAVLYRSCWIYDSPEWYGGTNPIIAPVQVFAVKEDGSLVLHGTGDYPVYSDGTNWGRHFYGYDPTPYYPGAPLLTPSSADIPLGTGLPKCLIGQKSDGSKHLVFAAWAGSTDPDAGSFDTDFNETTGLWSARQVVPDGLGGSTTITFPVTGAVPLQNPPDGFSCTYYSPSYQTDPTLVIYPLRATGGTPVTPSAFWTRLIGVTEEI